MKQFLDASGLNLYTQALKNGTLIAGRAQDSSRADYAKDSSTAFYASHADATGLIGIIPLANIPQGAIDKLVQVANKAARLALTIADVQNGDSVQELDSKKMYIVVDETQLGTEGAFVEYTAGRATFAQDASHADKATVADDASWADEAREVKWANVTEKDSSYNPAPHKHAWADITDRPTTWDASAVTMGGYEQKSGDVATTDSALVAIGKVEKKADDALAAAQAHTQDSSTITSMSEYQIADAYSAIVPEDSLDDAIGKLERLGLDASNSADWGHITNIPGEFTPANHDGAKVVSLATYNPTGVTGDVSTGDNLVTALAKIENKADAGADQPIPDATINAIVNGTF